MKNRVDKVVTRQGDQGQTALMGSQRYDKFDPQIELVGTLDEVNATLGLAAVQAEEPYQTALRTMQAHLFDIGAAVVMDKPQASWDEELERLDQQIQAWNSKLPPLTEFVLPGSNEVSARLHVARTVLRRAERLYWQVASPILQQSAIGAFLNRASDYLFVLSRVLSDTEVVWVPMGNGP